MTNQLVAEWNRGLIERTTNIVCADDLGLTRADGCFDATLLQEQLDGTYEAAYLEDHLDRLERSCATLGFECPPRDGWYRLVDQLADAWDEPEGGLKFIVTRGLEHGGGERTAFATLTSVDEHSIQEREGVNVISLDRGYRVDAFTDAPWLLGGVKYLSYAINMSAKRYARSQGCGDALFLAEGYVLEAPTASIVVRFGDRLVTTPHEGTGILKSITQQKVFEGAQQAGIECEYRLMKLEEVYEADGAWLLSSVRGTAPVTELDGRQLNIDQGWTDRIRSFNGF